MSDIQQKFTDIILEAMRNGASLDDLADGLAKALTAAGKQYEEDRAKEIYEIEKNSRANAMYDAIAAYLDFVYPELKIDSEQIKSLGEAVINPAFIETNNFIQELVDKSVQKKKEVRTVNCGDSADSIISNFLKAMGL